MNNLSIIIALVLVSVIAAGCSVVDEAAEREIERIVERNAEMKKAAETCEGIGNAARLVMERRSISKNGDELYYDYSLNIPVRTVSNLFREHLTANGWRNIYSHGVLPDIERYQRADAIVEIQYTGIRMGKTLGITCPKEKISE